MFGLLFGLRLFCLLGFGGLLDCRILDSRVIGHGLRRAGGQYLGYGLFLGLRDPQRIFVLHTNLTCHIFATETFVGRQPRGRIAIRLLLVGLSLYCQQIIRIIRQFGTLRLAEFLRALLPCVAQRHHMVDLYRCGGLPSLLERDVLAGIRIMQLAGFHHASVRTHLMLHVSQITVEDVVARIATVAIHIGPCLAELRALIPRLRGAAFDLQGIQRLSGTLAGTGIIGRFHGQRGSNR